MPADPLTITNAAVCDVRAGSLVPGQTIGVGNGRVQEIDRSARPSHGARVIDAAGRVVTPGLIDAHLHVTACTADLGAQAEWSPFYVAASSARMLRGMLERGFSTVRDVGGADYALAAAVGEGLHDGPRVGGKALSPTGGHADLRAPGRSVVEDHRCCPGLGVVCDGVDAVRRAARDQLRTGASHVKLMLSGGVASPTDRIDSLQFSDEEVAAVVEEAAAAKPVRGRARVHGASGEPRAAAEGAQHRAREPSRRRERDPVRRAAGVPDLLGAMQRHQSEEFRIRGEVQPAGDVLAAVTTVAADLLVVDGNPLEDAGVLADPRRHLRAVVQGGRVVSETTDLVR